MNKNDMDRLVELHEDMGELLNEAKNIIRNNSTQHEYEVAKQWIGNIDVGLGNGEYVDNYTETMHKMLKRIGAYDNEVLDDDEDIED